MTYRRLGYFWYAASAYLTLAILFAALGSKPKFMIPGGFLFDRFHLAALYFPLMVSLGTLMVQTERAPRTVMRLVQLSPVPFLTAALALQTAAARVELLAVGALTDAFGRIPATVLLILLFALEIAGVLKLAIIGRERGEFLFDLDRIKGWLDAFFYALGLVGGELDGGGKGASGSKERAPDHERGALGGEGAPLAEAGASYSNRSIFYEVGSEVGRAVGADEGPPVGERAAGTEEGSPESKRTFLDEAGSSALGGSGASDFAADTGVTEFDEGSQANIPDTPLGELLSERDLSDPAFAHLGNGEYKGESPGSSRKAGRAAPCEVNTPGDASAETGEGGGPPETSLAGPSTAAGPASRAGASETSEAGLSRDDESATSARPSEISLSEELYETEEGGAVSAGPSGINPGEDFPEDEEGCSRISEKLDPQGTEPRGIVGEKPAPTRPRGQPRYEVPSAGVLADYPDSDFSSIDDATRRGGAILEQTLKEFRIDARVTGIRKGPVITMYELLPSPGVKISSIVNLQDNIALRLAASRVRMVAPIPGKHAIGIEVPNKKRAIVSFSSMVESDEFREADAGIPVILGKDISGGNQVIDLTRTPHLLIAGATGSGKSVCVNSLIGSILYSRAPVDVKMIMVDPKIVELKLYNDIPHLLTPVITEPKRALQALQWCLCEMERRYSLLDSQGVRDMSSYNRRVRDRRLATERLPYIVVVVDEFADLMATSGKELEGIVARLAAMSRAVGIHLVLATQRPSVDVITGLIKANFPSRIAFMVAGKTDSRIIIDAMGAEKLLGRGDMLFTSAWDPFPSRMQGAFLAEEEVERMAEYVKGLGEPEYIDDEMFFDDDDDDEFELEAPSGDDPMYEKALEIVVSTRKASASYLQRRLKIGYNRAARLVEEMERRGIVGPANGSKPRDLIHIPDRFSTPLNTDNRESSSA